MCLFVLKSGSKLINCDYFNMCIHVDVDESVVHVNLLVFIVAVLSTAKIEHSYPSDSCHPIL